MKVMRLIRGINVVCYLLAIVLILMEFWQGPESLSSESLYTKWILLSLSGILFTGGLMRWAHNKQVMALALIVVSLIVFFEGFRM